MTSLRRRMSEDMCVRNLSARTRDNYIRAVQRFTRHFNRSPELLGPDEIRSYQVFLATDKRLHPSSINVEVCALRFLYGTTASHPTVSSPAPTRLSRRYGPPAPTGPDRHDAALPDAPAHPLRGCLQLPAKPADALADRPRHRREFPPAGLPTTAGPINAHSPERRRRFSPIRFLATGAACTPLPHSNTLLPLRSPKNALYCRSRPHARGRWPRRGDGTRRRCRLGTSAAAC